MSYRGTAPLSKFDYGATLVVSLAMMLVRQQDPVGFVLFDEAATKVLPPAATQAQIMVMSELLENCQPARKTELGGLLSSLCDRLRRRNMIVIVSDLFTDLEKVYDGLNRLRFLGHEVLVMQVLDRDELELPFDGPTIFHDIEGTDELFAEPWAFRKSYQKAMAEFLETVARECGKRGYDHVRFLTDSPLGSSLSYFLHSRQESGRAASPPGHTILTMLTLLSPALDLGYAPGSDTHHHPPAEPPPVPPRGMGADVLPAAHHPAQPQANPVRAVALAALAHRAHRAPFCYLARPLLNPTGLETWLGTGGRTSQVVLIDDSLSMGYTDGDSTAFTRAKEAAGGLLASVRPAGPLHDRDHLRPACQRVAGSRRDAPR